MSPAIAFELLRFEATPVSPAVALVEVSGRFRGVEPARPRLLVETDGVAREMPAVDAGGAPWSATFAVPLVALSEASFALVPGRGPLIALPAPTEAGGDDDRFVRLARTANDLRHRLGVATEAATAAEARAAAIADERDSLAAEVASLRAAVAAAQALAEESHAAALAAREAQAGAEGEAEQAREDAGRAHEEARAAVRSEMEQLERDAAAAREQLVAAQDRAVAAEDDARAARRDLRDARARVESLLRENRTARTAAAARARVPSRGAETPEIRAARLNAEWADGVDEADEPTAEHAPSPDSATAPLPDHPAAPPRHETVEEGERPSPPGDEPAADPLPADEPAAPPPPDAPRPADFSDDADDTAPLPVSATSPLHPAGEAPTTAHLAPVESDDARSPGLWRDDESIRMLRPRTSAGRLRPARSAVEDEDEETGDHVLDPAAVGARAIQPAEMDARRRALATLSNPRVIVGGIFLLLLVALVLIFLGIGPV